MKAIISRYYRGATTSKWRHIYHSHCQGERRAELRGDKRKTQTFYQMTTVHSFLVLWVRPHTACGTPCKTGSLGYSKYLIAFLSFWLLKEYGYLCVCVCLGFGYPVFLFLLLWPKLLCCCVCVWHTFIICSLLLGYKRVALISPPKIKWTGTELSPI